ncbi:MAG: helix-turn-helix domain-containing protein [Pseudomonadota bacterium]
MQKFNGAAPKGADLPTRSAGKGSIGPNKWQLLKIIEEIREPLGLKSTSITLLRAMLSYIRADILADSNDADHICFASNAALAKRTHVSVQTVERHISKLVNLGFLRRRSSSNGKRWAQRNRQGQIILATGLSLLPLVERHGEFIQTAQGFADRMRELLLLRNKCTTALAELRSHAPGNPALDTIVSRAKRLSRRKPDGEALAQLLKDISTELSKGKHPETACDTEKSRAAAHRSEGHKETALNRSVKEDTSSRIDVHPEQMRQAYPRLCAELRFTRSHEECARSMEEMASQLCLGNLWFTIRTLGPALSFMILGYLMERVETISNPKAYAWHLHEGLKTGTLDWRTLLRKPKRRRGEASPHIT